VILGIDASNLRTGGGLTHLQQFLQAAEPERHGIERILLWGGKSTLDELPARRWLRLIHEPLLDGALHKRLLWQWYMLPALAASGCDLLFSPGGNSRPSRLPSVVMCRNMLPFEPEELARYKFSFEFVRLSLLARSQARSFRTADGVIFLTEYARSAVMQRVRELRGLSTVIPHGVDPRFRRKVQEEGRVARPPDAAFRFLYVSTIDLYKHQEKVAHAVADLRKKGYPVGLDLVGAAYPPALKELMSEIKRLGPAASTVVYHGPAPFATLEGLYHRADAFVFASSCENLPNILVEAMASGLAVACSRRGPMPEVLGDAGVYFDPEDSGSIGTALERIVSSAELRSRLSAAAQKRSQRYSWTECATRTLTFLQQVAATTASPTDKAHPAADSSGGSVTRRHSKTPNTRCSCPVSQFTSPVC
jgi:glycosyltransferase involved in cell wall biosynthesis